MGHVFIATDHQLHRRVAIKRMKAEHGASLWLRQQFEREAKIVAGLRNPHIVQVFDYGVDGGMPYLVMELLDGEDVDSYLRRKRRLSLPQAAALFSQIAKGLASAHASGLVHRALKPSNLFLARTDVGEVLKILDFGLATPVEPAEAFHQKQKTGIVGTPHYMSPEQIHGRPVDHRADLWALGIIAYEMLTGQLPLNGDSSGKIFLRISTEQPAPPSSLQKDLGPAIDAFFERALAREPVLRFQSVREMASAFAHLADQAPETRPARVLVIDDEEDMEMLLKMSFRRQIQNGTLQFLLASDGEQGLEQLRQHPDIDLVLSDINMPGMNVLTFLARQREEHPLVRVVIVSAYGDMKNIRTAMNRGAFDFIIKPIDFQDLEATIQKTLKEVREVRRQLRSVEENRILRMFVHDGIVERLLPVMRNADMVASEIVNATVVSIRLWNFGAGARSALPDQVVDRLNVHYDVIVPEVSARGGIVDKYIGDTMIASFRGQEHAVRALDACIALRDRLVQIGGSPVQGVSAWCGVAIGVESGDMVFGGIGSRSGGRLDYAVLGDVVDSAIRLTALAREHQIYVGAAVREQTADVFEFEALGDQVVPGCAETSMIFLLTHRRITGSTASLPSSSSISSDEALVSADPEELDRTRKEV